MCTGDIKAEGSRRADVGGEGKGREEGGLGNIPRLEYIHGARRRGFPANKPGQKSDGEGQEREGEGSGKVEFRSQRDGSSRGCKLTVR